MKKIMSIVLAICLIFSTGICFAYAAEETTAGISTASALPGEKVEIFVSIDSAEGIKTLSFYDFVYDNAVLTIVEAECEWLTEGKLSDIDFENNASIITFEENTPYSGNVLKLVFTVSENATLGATPISCKVKGTRMVNKVETEIAISITAGEIVVSEASGDLSDFEYELTADGIVIVGYVGDKKAIVINESYEINGTSYDVVEIAESAYENNEIVESVTIPSTVSKIGDYAFYNCTNLTSVTLLGENTEIGEVALGYYYISKKEDGVVDGFTIYGFEGSTAQAYAESDAEITFVALKEECVHIPGAAVTENYIAPTATQKGSKDIVVYCSLCGEELSRETVILEYTDDHFTGIKDDYFYKDGVLQRAYQLVEFEGNYYFINNGNMIAKNTRIYLSQKFVEGTDLVVGYYDFDAEGKLVMKNGPEGDFFYRDGIQLKAYQLVEFEGDYYFINDGNRIAKNIRIYLSQRFVEGTPLAVGYYEFGADGKMAPMNGPIGDYFYKDGVMQKAYQLVEYKGNFYFVNDSHKLAKNKRIYLSERFTNGFTYSDGTPITPGYYDFDENGKMVFNGPIGDYFYKDGAVLKAYQLVEYKGDYYFVNDSNKLAKNKRIYLSQRFVEGTTLAVGYYEFGADGKMVALNGPVGDYFYKDGAMLKAYQLVEFEGNYYFINNGNKLAKNTRIYLSQKFVDGTPLAVGYYDFDANGKLIIK